MTFLIVIVGWIVSLCLHEYSHARVAYQGGDTSVERKGYLSFNPLRYTDPVFSIVMPLLFLLLGGLGLPGGAVYIEHWRLRNRHWDAAVSAAGPLSNLLVAVVIALLFRFTPVAQLVAGPALAFLGMLQVSAVILNLLPIPPLDGYGILSPYLTASARSTMDRAGTWSLWVLFLALWYVPAFNQGFWDAVYTVSGGMGIPLDMAMAGLRDFLFWRSW